QWRQRGRCARCEGVPMHVGLATVFQNPKKTRSDYDVYRNELRLADQAEPLGFESIWGVEHHFTDYTMCPDVLQFLTYMAGRTRQAGLGSMVVVLPWHDPMRVAEEVSMLDNISDGRLILGLGRGAARVRRLAVLRRERGARARDGPPLHRWLLPDRPRPLQLPGRPPREDQGLRVLREDGREDPAVRDRQGDRVLHEPPGLGHARAV